MLHTNIFGAFGNPKQNKWYHLLHESHATHWGCSIELVAIWHDSAEQLVSSSSYMEFGKQKVSKILFFTTRRLPKKGVILFFSKQFSKLILMVSCLYLIYDGSVPLANSTAMAIANSPQSVDPDWGDTLIKLIWINSKLIREESKMLAWELIHLQKELWVQNHTNRLC